MSGWRRVAVVAIFAGVGAILAVPYLIGPNPASVASLTLGTDDAFAVSGMEPRENQIGGGALRWTRPQAAFRFEGLGPGAVRVALEIRSHRTEVNLTANGALVGTLPPGEREFSSSIQLSGTALDFGIETEGFEASGRRLGAQFVSLRVTKEGAAKPGFSAVPGRLFAALGAVLLVSAVSVATAGLGAWGVFLPPFALLVLVLPAGLWRSSWLFECAAAIATATIVSALVSARARGSVSMRTCLHACLFSALVVHGVLPPSPLVVQGDVQLHGNKLAEVARGNAFPTTRTDHKPPFEIPYGFGFYGLLTPFATPGASNVPVVRHAAAFLSALSAVGLAFLLGRSSACFAGAAVLLWALTPVNIRTMGYGNLSNVFAQAVFVLFLVAAAAMSGGRLKNVVLTFLVALSATAHLSAFIVLAALLVVSLAFASDRRGPAFKPLFAGTAVAGVYFATFVPLIASQAPRLLGERGGSSGVFDPWRLPNQVVASLGWPLLGLLVLSGLVAGFRLILPLGRSLLVTGVLLGIAALVSPVEVRYLLALSPLLAVLAAAVFEEDEGPSFPRQTLSSIVDLKGLRTLGTPLVKWPLVLVILAAACFNGALVLLEFIPLSGL